MYTRHFTALLVIGAVSAMTPSAAQERDRTRDATQSMEQAREQEIYGSQLMTDRERNDYRARMRAARTAEERERVRAEHHANMQQRAKERGLTLPEQPPTGGIGGMGPGGGGMGSGGGGMGSGGGGMGPGGGGMGPGGGAGPGGGRGR